jgi:hypothetical protein
MPTSYSPKGLRISHDKVVRFEISHNWGVDWTTDPIDNPPTYEFKDIPQITKMSHFESPLLG